MKKKIKWLILAVAAVMASFAVFAFAACVGGNGDPNADSGTGGSSQSGGSGESGSGTGGGSSTDATPTSAEVVTAIKQSVEADEQNYDFTLNLAGNISVGFMQSPDANANYDCNYRYNAQTGALQFKRVTSGALLYDATEYIYSSGDSRVAVKMNDKNVVKKVVVNYKDSELKLVNIPFTTLISSLTSSEITNISKVTGGSYRAKLKLSSGNVALNAICGLLGKMDTSISLKGVTVTNPTNGIDFSFTMSNGKFTGYTVKASVSVPVSKAEVALDLTYTQRAATTAVQLPDVTGVVTDSAQIGEELTSINNALNGVKSDGAYSLDFHALNEMDPSWKQNAIKDYYDACLYKNTTNGRVDFNHSFEFHSHHETDGAEAYKYTIGNTEDGTVYNCSFKGSNKQTEIQKTVDSQFEFLTKNFIYTAADVDCLKKVTNAGKTTYTIYLKDSVVVQKSKDILAILNTNDAEGVVDVDNYFNDDEYTIKDAELTVVMNGQSVESMNLKTQIKYNPTSGEYTENNVTLDNELALYVNKNLAKAQSYKAPSQASSIDYKSPNV